MAPNTVTKSASVVRLDTHPAFCAAERRSREFEEAMRRHPASQSRLPVRMPPSAPPLRRV
ncbi:hypothetical protein ACTWP6_10540 [Mycobacterium sp. 4D054]|uniref:hypothetical protein n=1 Tax=Mycobacterium sp. 4D054 TaxID=3457440 RepID=UPI003FD370E4